MHPLKLIEFDCDQVEDFVGTIHHLWLIESTFTASSPKKGKGLQHVFDNSDSDEKSNSGFCVWYFMIPMKYLIKSVLAKNLQATKMSAHVGATRICRLLVL